jgi:hypothetical protein
VRELSQPPAQGLADGALIAQRRSHAQA